MDATAFLDDLRDDHETALSRLGSSKGVYAMTGGEMEAEAVRAAVADRFASLAAVAESWADEVDGDVADCFEGVASTLANHVDVAPDGHDPASATALSDALEEADTSAERLGALAGALLVLGKQVEQCVGFFVGDADPMAANEFRDVRGDVEDGRDWTAEVLAETASGADAESARQAADEVVETAYDWYVETLEGMGVKPKNVC